MQGEGYIKLNHSLTKWEIGGGYYASEEWVAGLTVMVIVSIAR